MTFMNQTVLITGAAGNLGRAVAAAFAAAGANLVLLDLNEDALKALSLRTGGFHERVFSTMAVEAQMRRMSDLLASQYRAGYAPTTDPRSTKVEIRTSRKDVRLKLSQRLSTAW